jgi:hypothetical protein
MSFIIIIIIIIIIVFLVATAGIHSLDDINFFSLKSY